MAINILVVDDEEAIADLVEVYLKSENYNVLKCYNGKDALFESASYSYYILSETPSYYKEATVNADGSFSFSEVKGATAQKLSDASIDFTTDTKYGDYELDVNGLPKSVNTVYGIDKITGLTIGADDYITKPFQMLELVARVKAQLRRVTKYNQQDVKMNENVIIIGGLVVDKENHECTINDEPLSLTPTEFSILWVLCKNRGKVVDSEKLF